MYMRIMMIVCIDIKIDNDNDTIMIKSFESLLFVFVFWVDGYNKKTQNRKENEKKSMSVCVRV